ILVPGAQAVISAPCAEPLSPQASDEAFHVGCARHPRPSRDLQAVAPRLRAMRTGRVRSLSHRTREAYGPGMRFQVLGPLEVTRDNGPISLGGPKQRVVLAHLIVRANQMVPMDALIDQVWGEEPPDSARNVLQTYVSRLRKILGPERIE